MAQGHRTNTGLNIQICWRALSDPRLLHLTVNSLFLVISFSFRSLFIKYGRYSLKTDRPWKYWEASKPFFFISHFMCIFEILKLGFCLFQQVLGQFRQISVKSSCFVCLRPVKYACWTLVREPRKESRGQQWPQVFRKSPRSGVRLPWFSPSATTFWLLGNYSTFPLTPCRIRAALAGLLGQVSDKKRSAQSLACHKHSAPVGAVPLEAWLGDVAASCLRRVGTHCALNIDSSPGARMTTARPF